MMGHANFVATAGNGLHMLQGHASDRHPHAKSFSVFMVHHILIKFSYLSLSRKIFHHNILNYIYLVDLKSNNCFRQPSFCLALTAIIINVTMTRTHVEFAKALLISQGKLTSLSSSQILACSTSANQQSIMKMC